MGRPKRKNGRKRRTNTTYAVKKGKNKKAVRVLPTRKEADEYAQKSPEYHVEVRAGKRTRCEDYCVVNRVCPFYNKEVKNG